MRSGDIPLRECTHSSVTLGHPSGLVRVCPGVVAPAVHDLLWIMRGTLLNMVRPHDSEPLAAVFARLAEVPLDTVDKLMEVVQRSYVDLNNVREHEYWGGLVLHQGAAMRSLTELRECLDAFRAEAVGARNTELGISVATAVIDGQRSYAQTETTKRGLIENVLQPKKPEHACHLYVWDRPYDNDEIAGPYERLRIVVDPEAELGVLNYTEETDEGDLHSWHTLNPEPIAVSKPFRFDAGSALTFPSTTVLAYEQLRHALLEFAQSGRKPECVSWQQARWGE